MKKVFLTLALMLTTMVASAQWYVGGGIGFGKSEIAEVETTQFAFTPEAGYTIDENWTVGAALGVDWTKDTYTQFSVNPYVRYTFFKVGNFSFFADGVVELGSVKPDEGDSSFTWGIGVKPGIGYSFTEHFSIAGHLGWLGHRDFDDAGEATAITLNSSNLSFSLYYSF